MTVTVVAQLTRLPQNVLNELAALVEKYGVHDVLTALADITTQRALLDDEFALMLGYLTGLARKQEP